MRGQENPQTSMFSYVWSCPHLVDGLWLENQAV
jgi:hypothetical protein